MLRPKPAAETSVCPGLSESIMRIARAGIVTHPAIVPGVYVRNVRMASLIDFHVVLGRGPRLLTPCRSRYAHGCGSPFSRTVRRNVSTANRGMTAAAVRPPTALVKSSHADQSQWPGYRSHIRIFEVNLEHAPGQFDGTTRYATLDLQWAQTCPVFR